MFQIRRFVTAACLCGLTVTLCTGIAIAQQQDDATPQVIRGASRSAPVTPFFWNGDTLELPTPERWQPGDPVKEIPRRAYDVPGRPAIPYYEPGPDPLLQIQLDYSPSLFTRVFDTPNRNFAGQDYTGVNPPDTVGEVGPGHYVQMINGGGGALVAIYDKAEPTPNLLSSFALDSLGSGVCAGGRGDPIVIYDRPADRWLLSEFSVSGNNLCVYISQTPDPTGAYFAYGFTAPSFPDYPKYGTWPTDANGGGGSYIVTANDGGPGVYALDRGAMLAGSAATFQRLTVPPLSGFNFQNTTPADLDGPNVPASGAGAIIMRQRDTENHGGPAAPGDLLEMWSFQVDWNSAANTTLSTTPSIDVAEFDSALCGLTAFFCFPQPGSSTTLDPLREVIMNRLQYINHGDRETLVGNFVVDVNGADHGGLRWFELERQGGGGWTLNQEGTYAPDGDDRWMAGSSMDQSGNIAIAYNITSSTTFPSLRYTGRLADDPLGVMTQPETVIHPGAAANSSNRYGDYSSMNLDPEDDCTFWFTGMDNITSNWRTQIASFRFDACGCELFPDPPSTSADTNGDNRIDISWDDSSLSTVVEYVVQRSRTPGGPYDTIAVVPDSSPDLPNGPGYTYEDIGVSGSITYYYTVIASDGGACKSAPTNEASATATGPCTLDPLFDGLASAETPFTPICAVDLAWASGSSQCGGAVSYDVYRSLDPDFVPPSGLIVEGLSGTSYRDVNALETGVTYYYAVRARDLSNNKQEQNEVKLSVRPQGELATGTWFDDAGDSEPAKLTGESPWSVDPDEGNFGPSVYKTGSYPNQICSGLATPVLRLGTASQLTFYSRYDIESSYDKGEVQISLDGGESWDRVPMTYPGTSTNSSDSCGFPTGQYFTASDLSWQPYTADLSAYGNQFVQLRFVMSTDVSVNGTGWWIDDIMITQVDVPGDCATGSSCEDNPVVNIDPAGDTVACTGSTVLSANTDGGTGPFSYQWTKDGVEIAGATDSTYVPGDDGLHLYNCRVKAASCDDPTFASQAARITASQVPAFGGVVSAVDAQGSDCSVALDWNAASTLCDGPLSYYVFRDTTPDVAPLPENIAASGVTGTSYVDAGGLAEGQTYFYLVQVVDRSTSQFDGNAVVVSAQPTGPGTGISSFFFEDFTDPNVLSQWATGVQPGSRSCGLWERTNSTQLRPSGASGFFASSNGSVCGNQKTATTLESPSIDIGLGGVQKVTLSMDLYYNFLNAATSASIEVWDGSAWQAIWTSPEADVNTALSFDVTAFAAGNADFRLRFIYDDIDQWLSVDNVDVTVDVVNSCASRFGPPSVPDGRAASTPLRADRTAGDEIQLSWDAASCSANDYNLLYGDLSSVATYALGGSECSLGTAGSYSWTNVPSGDLFFLVVGADADGTESSWGTDNLFGERNGPMASGECSATTKDTSGDCP